MISRYVIDKWVAYTSADAARTALQEVLNRSLVSLGGQRTLVEEVRWDNMRKSVGSYDLLASQTTRIC